MSLAALQPLIKVDELVSFLFASFAHMPGVKDRASKVLEHMHRLGAFAAVNGPSAVNTIASLIVRVFGGARNTAAIHGVSPKSRPDASTTNSLFDLEAQLPVQDHASLITPLHVCTVCHMGDLVPPQRAWRYV